MFDELIRIRRSCPNYGGCRQIERRECGSLSGSARGASGTIYSHEFSSRPVHASPQVDTSRSRANTRYHRSIPTSLPLPAVPAAAGRDTARERGRERIARAFLIASILHYIREYASSRIEIILDTAAPAVADKPFILRYLVDRHSRGKGIYAGVTPK